MDTRTPPTTMLTRDLDSKGLAFWAVVSGTWTLDHARSMLADTHGENLMRSRFSSALTKVLHTLACNGVLDPRTEQPPFDSNRRCRECGTVHADHPVVARSGEGCFRTMWGGPVKLNTAGLRPPRRR